MTVKASRFYTSIRTVRVACTTVRSTFFCPSWFRNTLSEQRCFVLNGFARLHDCQNNVVLSLMVSLHHTTVIATLFCPSWLHHTTGLSEQRCFVLHGFTTLHDCQNNVVLSFMASSHYTTVRATLFYSSWLC